MSSDNHWTTTVTPSDVLFGRGSGPSAHEGNIQFRHLVNSRKETYNSTISRQVKTAVARQILNIVYDKEGRFLKKATAKDASRLGIPSACKDDAYLIVDDFDAMEKAKQALRQRLSYTMSAPKKVPPKQDETPSSSAPEHVFSLSRNLLSGPIHSNATVTKNTTPKITSLFPKDNQRIHRREPEKYQQTFRSKVRPPFKHQVTKPINRYYNGPSYPETFRFASSDRVILNFGLSEGDLNDAADDLMEWDSSVGTLPCLTR